MLQKFTTSVIRRSLNLASFSSSNQSKAIRPVNLAYKIFGNHNEAPPLILHHGLYGSKSNFQTFSKRMVNHLEPRRIVISVDLRNHGESPHSPDHTYDHMAADTRALLKKLNLDKVALLGHSMGGGTVMKFTLQYPELLEKLIVVDMSVITEGDEMGYHLNLLKFLKSCPMPSPKTSFVKAIEQVDALIASQIKDRPTRHSLVANLRKSKDGYYWRINLGAILENFGHFVPYSFVGSGTFSGPTLFLEGGKSNFIKKAHRAEIIKVFPKAEITVVENAGHVVHIDQPEMFFQQCLKFLNK